MKKNTSLRDHAVRTVHFGDVSIAELCVKRQPAGESSSTAPISATSRALLFVLNGELCLRYRGEPLRVEALEWSPYDPGHILLSASENTRALIVTVPADGDVPTGTHSAAEGADSVLLACLRSALAAADGLSSRARAELGNSIIDLAALACREKSVPARRLPGRRMMCERVKVFVRHHLRKSTLSIEDIARTFNCTKRYLHKAFSENERSLAQYIWDLRLERCSRDLASPDLAARSITEIAFGWGFRSTPHFSRAFRRRFGLSPRDYRTANLPKRQPAPSASQGMILGRTGRSAASMAV